MLRVQREVGGELVHAGLERLDVGGGAAFSAVAMISATSVNSSAPKPRVARAGVPMRRPEVTIGGRGSNGTALRLTVMPDRVQEVFGLLAVELGVAQIDQHQVHVGAAGQD